jgi:hypothetical protein
MKCFVSLASAIEELANVNSQNITDKIIHSLHNIIFNHQSINLTSFKFSNIKHKQLRRKLSYAIVIKLFYSLLLQKARVIIRDKFFKIGLMLSTKYMSLVLGSWPHTKTLDQPAKLVIFLLYQVQKQRKKVL